jgi:hypothetical protein
VSRAALRADLAAVLLGVGWFAVLLIPPWTRSWLLEERGAVPGHLALLAVSSVIVARVGRRFVARADSLAADLWRAVVMPAAGCLVYLTLWNFREWLRPPRGVANLHDTLVLYLWGPVAVALSGYVVVPYGYCCQRVMRSLLQNHEGRFP